LELQKAGMECLSVALAPTVAAVAVMIPVIVMIAPITPVALAAAVIAPLMPGMSIIPITVLVPEGDISKVDGDSTALAAVTAVSSLSVRHAP